MKKLSSIFSVLLLLQFTSATATGSDNLTSTSASFVENKGQIKDQHRNTRSDIDFKLQQPGVTLFVGDGQLHYQWTKPGDKTVDVYRMDVTLLGANPNAEMVKGGKQPDFDTYFFGSEKNGTVCGRYATVRYKNIYPGIDWVLYSTASGFKYDFVVGPGADASLIKLKFEGATNLATDKGAFTATTPMGTVSEQAPYSYVRETRKQVPSAFVLDNNVLSFDIERSTQQLVIDPTVQWATYYGGSGNENYYGTSTDQLGNVLLCGSTFSTNNIATTGAFQTTIAAGQDALVAKFTSTGQRIWGTYLGGWGEQWTHQIVSGKNGDIFVGGSTDSTDMMTLGAHQVIQGNIGAVVPGNAPFDGLVAKLDMNGQRIWATYYGGSENESTACLATDTAGNLYLAGKTISPENIATPGTFAPAPGPNAGRGFLVKFNAAGQRQWGTYYGGGGAEIFDMHADNKGGIYSGKHRRYRLYSYTRRVSDNAARQ